MRDTDGVKVGGSGWDVTECGGNVLVRGLFNRKFILVQIVLSSDVYEYSGSDKKIKFFSRWSHAHTHTLPRLILGGNFY